MTAPWQKWLAAISLVATCGLLLLWTMSERGYADALHGNPDTTHHRLLDEVIALMDAHYDGPVDRIEMINGALRGAADSVGDRYTELQVPVEAQQHREETSGQFAGIGVVISRQLDGTLRVVSVRSGGPAKEAGVLKGDLIVSADGKSVRGLEQTQSMSLVRGEPGTKVRLGIVRDGEERELLVTRREIVIESVEGMRMLDDALAVGYLRISAFSAHTPSQFKKAVVGLREKGMKSLVIDLRINGGGLFESAVQVADELFDKEGIILSKILAADEKALARRMKIGVNGANSGIGRVELTRDSVAVHDGPVVLLVDRGTASASEVLAGCLQDWGRAFIIGESTFGKALVQWPIDLPSDPRYTLKVTVASYVTPLGNLFRPSSDFDDGGLQPDLQIDLSDHERWQLSRRFSLQQYDVPTGIDEIEGEEDRKAWLARDRHIQAALAYFRGEPVVMADDE